MNIKHVLFYMFYYSEFWIDINWNNNMLPAEVHLYSPQIVDHVALLQETWAALSNLHNASIVHNLWFCSSALELQQMYSIYN